jgi:hypothetical protein
MPEKFNANPESLFYGVFSAIESGNFSSVVPQKTTTCIYTDAAVLVHWLT